MRIGFISSNANFAKGIINELDRRGHEVLLYQHTDNELQNIFQIGQMKTQCERVFVDFAQYPLEYVLSEFNCPIFVRMHRLEVYNAEYLNSLDWSKVNGIFFVSEAVRQKFIQTVQKPPQQHYLYHVGIDTDNFTFKEKNWEAPYTVMIAGNVVPKKRVYTAVQLVYDLGEDYQLEIRGNAGFDTGYGNPEYHHNIGDLIQRLDMGHRVISGPSMKHEELIERMQKGHFILSASNEEGCHTTVAEGMACGMIPLVNGWVGAENIYPEEYIWNSPKEFYNIVNKFEKKKNKNKISKEMSEYVQKYNIKDICSNICDAISGPIDADSTDYFYSNVFYEHMITQDGNARQEEAFLKVYTLLQDMKNPSVLEVGAGTGWISRRLSALGIKATGQDVSQGLLQFAVDNNPGGATFVRHDITDKLATGPYDLISAIDVLEHVDERKVNDLVIRMIDELKVNGKMILRFPWGKQDSHVIENTVFPKVIKKILVEHNMEILDFGPILGNVYFEIVASKKPLGGF